MKAAYNMKVNGRWIHAGETYENATPAPEQISMEDESVNEEAAILNDGTEPEKKTRRGRRKAE